MVSSLPTYARAGRGSGMIGVLNRSHSLVVSLLQLSIPFTIFTRHVPHEPLTNPMLRLLQLTYLVIEQTKLSIPSLTPHKPLLRLTPALTASVRRFAPSGTVIS